MTDMKFTYDDLQEIIKIKDRVIHSLLFGGGGALSKDEKEKLDILIIKAKNCLEGGGVLNE